MNRRHIVFGALLLLASTAGVSAQDAGLYDAPPPPDSAFVRIIRASGTVDAAQIGPSTVSFDQSISPYVIVKAGPVDLALGSAKQTVTVEMGRFYTMAMSDGMAGVLFEDAPIENPAKSAVYLYNLGAADAALFAPKQNVEVVAAVAPGKSGNRMINAVTLDLDVVSDGKTTSIAGVALERRSGTSIAVLPDGAVVMARNNVSR